MAAVIFTSCSRRTIKNIPPSVDYACTASILLGSTIYLEKGTAKLCKFKVAGINDDVKRKIKFEVTPNDNFSLSTQGWDAENEWMIKTNISCKTEGKATMQVYVDGVKKNTINLVCKILDKDIFTKSEIDRLKAENKKSLDNHTPCIVAADKQLGKLFNDSGFFITDTSTNKANVNTIYTRGVQIVQKGYAQAEKTFLANTFVSSGYKKPTEYSEGKEDCLSKYIKESIKNRAGFHVYYFTILNGYHVLTLVVDATDICEMRFRIYDQLKNRDEKNIEDIDIDFLELNKNNWSGAAMRNNDNTASTKFALWKIKRL